MAEHPVQLDHEPYDRAMDASTADELVEVTILLTPERVERARKAVKFGYAPSVDAWFEEALRRHDSKHGWCETWEEAFEAWVREYGPFTDEELACARRDVLGT